jgi:hypothetical protein
MNSQIRRLSAATVIRPVETLDVRQSASRYPVIVPLRRTSTTVSFGSSVKLLASMIATFSAPDFNVRDRSGTHSSAGKRIMGIALVHPFHR